MFRQGDIVQLQDEFGDVYSFGKYVRTTAPWDCDMICIESGEEFVGHSTGLWYAYGRHVLTEAVRTKYGTTEG